MVFPVLSLIEKNHYLLRPDPDQFARMMLEGRHATVPKIERIRNTTQISRTFDDCLKRMSESYRYVMR